MAEVLSQPIDLEQARSLISEAQNLKVYPGPMPEDDLKILEEAGRILDQAVDAYKGGAHGPKIRTILALGGQAVGLSIPEDDEQEPEPERVPEPEGRAEAAPDREEPAQASPDTAYEQQQLALARVKKTNLPVPPEIEGEPPTLQRDITSLSDQEIRRYHGEFSACLSSAIWHVALAEADTEAAKRIAEHHFNRAMSRVDRLDPSTNKAKLASVVEAEASEDPEVIEWREQEVQHRDALRYLKALRETYRGKCELLDAETTWRMAERKHS